MKNETATAVNSEEKVHTLKSEETAKKINENCGHCLSNQLYLFSKAGMAHMKCY